jgi:hypothetical protein
MPTPERVQPYKSESTAAGGSDAEAAPYPVLIKPQSEAIDAAGIYLQDLANYDYNVLISRSANDLVFTDVTTGALTLSNASNLLLNQKRAVVVASVGANIALTGTYTLDGIGISVGDRVLAKDQTTGADRGIYVAAAGAWTRATDMDSTAKILPGLEVGVISGTLNGGSFWRMTNTSAPTLGVTTLVFAAITKSVLAGNGMTGGGLLTSDVTLTLGTPSDITSVSTNSVSGSTHSHALAAAAVTYAKFQDLSALSVFARAANSTGVGASVAAVAASGAVLRESGSTIGFGTIASAGIATAAVTFAKIQDLSALSVFARSANSTGVGASVAAVAASGAVLRESGSVLGFGTVATAGLTDAAVTYAKIQNLSALSVLARSANSIGVGASVAAVAASDAVLRESGSVLGFGTVATGGLANNAVTYAKMQTVAAKSVIGNATNATTTAAAISASVTGPLVGRATTVGFRKDNYAAAVAPTVTDDTSASYEVSSVWQNTVMSRAHFAISVGAGTAVWASTYDGPTTALVVGNALEGDTLRNCDYLDPGDGTGIAAALASGGTAKTVVIRRGMYTLAATQALLPVPAGWTVRGEGMYSTMIRPRIGDAATIPWACMTLAGEGARIENLGFAIRDRAATVPALTATIGVIENGAKNTRVRDVYVVIPGAILATSETLAAFSMTDSAHYGGQVVDDLTLDMTNAVVTGDASSALTFAAIATGSGIAVTQVAATLAATTAEPLFTRIRVIGGKTDLTAVPSYHTAGILGVTLTQFTARHCEFNGVWTGVLVSCNSTVGAISTTGPRIEQCTVNNADGLVGTFITGGVVLIATDTAPGTLAMTRIHIKDLYNLGGPTGDVVPGIFMVSNLATMDDVRIEGCSAIGRSASVADAVIKFSSNADVATATNINIVNNTAVAAGGIAYVSIAATATGTVNDGLLSGNKCDALQVDGANVIDTIVVNNRIRNVGGYYDTGTDTSTFNNIIG